MLDCICSPYPCGLQLPYLVFPPSGSGQVRYRADTLEPAHSRNIQHRLDVTSNYFSVLPLLLPMGDSSVFTSCLCPTHLLTLLQVHFTKVTANHYPKNSQACFAKSICSKIFGRLTLNMLLGFLESQPLNIQSPSMGQRAKFGPTYSIYFFCSFMFAVLQLKGLRLQNF